MQLSDFDYHLPERLIARFPLEKRSDSRLLYLPKQGDCIDNLITDLPQLLGKNDLIVFNDTKVIKARLHGNKASGGQVEVLVERLLDTTNGQQIFAQLQQQGLLATHTTNHIALCHIRASKAPKVGTTVFLAQGNIEVEVLGRADNLFIVHFHQPILSLLEQYGELPIPPYFERKAEQLDETRYQTVFHDPAKSASVAAPTASLHFDEALLHTLANKGIQHTFVTLHVGAGTFAPVRTDNILQHKMHAEYASLSQSSADKINATKQAGGRVIAVGTTVTRVLETAWQQGLANVAHANNTADLSLQAWSGDTDIFIYPGFQFGVVDRLITNFHLPKSTLLMLVAAFAGQQRILQAYQHAITHDYRFFSYGDAMLLDNLS